jgi:hypothetical protein
MLKQKRSGVVLRRFPVRIPACTRAAMPECNCGLLQLFHADDDIREHFHPDPLKFIIHHSVTLRKRYIDCRRSSVVLGEALSLSTLIAVHLDCPTHSFTDG